MQERREAPRRLHAREEVFAALIFDEVDARVRPLRAARARDPRELADGSRDFVARRATRGSEEGAHEERAVAGAQDALERAAELAADRFDELGHGGEHLRLAQI